MTITEEGAGWDGSTLPGQVIAIGIQDDLLPRSRAGEALPPLLGVATEAGTASLESGQLGPFLEAHADALLVCYEAARLFWAAVTSLDSTGHEGAARQLWSTARACRLHGLRLLCHLMRMLQKPNQTPLDPEGNGSTADLAALARAYRRRFEGGRVREQGDDRPPAPADVAGEILAIYRLCSGTVEELALKLDEREQVPSLREAHENLQTYGPLGLGIQVQGAIAAARCAANGIRPDPGASPVIREEWISTLRQRSTTLARSAEARAAFVWNDTVIRENKAHLPEINPDALRSWLASYSDARLLPDRAPIIPPTSPGGHISTDPDDWGRQVELDHLLAAWADVRAAASLHKATRGSRGPTEDTIRPQYRVLPHLGSSRPDLGSYRRLFETRAFRPRPDYRFVAGRLEDLELRCLADALEPDSTYDGLRGWLRRGLDPVLELTWRLCAEDGRDPMGREEFLAEEREDPAWGRKWRAVARGLLAFVPRGVSPELLHALLSDELLADVEESRRAVDAFFWNLPEFRRRSEGWMSAWAIRAKLGLEDSDFAGRAFDFDIISCASHIANVAAGRVRPGTATEEVLGRADAGWGERSRGEGIGPGLADELASVLSDSPIGRWRTRTGWSRAQLAEHLDFADDVLKATSFAVVDAGHRLVAVAGAEFVVEVLRTAPAEVDQEIGRVAGMAAAALFRDRELAPPCRAERRDDW